jgi:hypothetical protein
VALRAYTDLTDTIAPEQQLYFKRQLAFAKTKAATAHLDNPTDAINWAGLSQTAEHGR